MGQLVDLDNDEFDYSDERYIRRLKRKRFDIKGFETCDFNDSLRTSLNDDRIMDDDYCKYLEYLCGSSVTKPIEVEVEKDSGDDADGDDDDNDGDDDDNDDEADPHFKMFLDNLIADGKSYVLKVDKGDGVLEFLKYEGLGSDDESDTENWRKSRDDIRREKVEGRKAFRNVHRRENVENLPGKEKRNLGVQRRDDLGYDKSGGSDDGCDTENVGGRKYLRNVQRRDNFENSKSLLEKEKRNFRVQRSDDVKILKNSTQKEKKNLVQNADNGENLKSVPGKDMGNLGVQRRDDAENSKSFPQKERMNLVQSTDIGENMKSLPGKDRRNSVVEKRNLWVQRRDDVKNSKSSTQKEKRNLVQNADNGENLKSVPVKDMGNLGVQRRDDVENSKSFPQKERMNLVGQNLTSLTGKDRRNSVVERNLRVQRRDDAKNLKISTQKEKRSLVQNADTGGNLKSVPGKDMGNLGVHRRRDDVENLKSFPQKERMNLVQSTDNGENLKSLSGKDRRNSVVEKNLRSDDDRDMRIRRNLRDATENEKIEEREDLRNVQSRGNVKKTNRFLGKERENSVVGKNLRPEQLSDKGCLSEKVVRVDNHILNPQPKCDKEDGNFDSCYKLFMNHSLVEGGYLVHVSNGKRVIYEKVDDESSSDSEILVLENAPDSVLWSYTPGLDSNVLDASMEEDDCQCLGSLSKAENPQFRKGVMDILRRPYNKEEYERLWQDVKARKQTEGHIELRGVTKSFRKDTIGKSYLDHYIDLERQLDAVQHDLPKKLNILRGFFYYLENMSADGKFKPWLDKSCLAIVPTIP